LNVGRFGAAESHRYEGKAKGEKRPRFVMVPRRLRHRPDEEDRASPFQRLDRKRKALDVDVGIRPVPIHASGGFGVDADRYELRSVKEGGAILDFKALLAQSGDEERS